MKQTAAGKLVDKLKEGIVQIPRQASIGQEVIIEGISKLSGAKGVWVGVEDGPRIHLSDYVEVKQLCRVALDDGRVVLVPRSALGVPS